MDFLHWLSHNWFDSVEKLSIAAGLFFSAYNTRIDWKSRHLSSQIEITKQHREIWAEVAEKPELSRVTQEKVDLKLSPVTSAEAEFVNSLIQHLNLVRSAIKLRMYIAPDKMGDDIREFFGLPIPRAVWESNRRFQNGDFIVFVERYLKGARD